jgi:hypothetical protein
MLYPTPFEPEELYTMCHFTLPHRRDLILRQNPLQIPYTTVTTL